MPNTTTATTARYIGSSVHVLPQTNLLRALHTAIRERGADRERFVTHSARIIRLLIEAALDRLPFEEHEVLTPVGASYRGTRIAPEICGVSVVRAGDSMEAELRAILPGIRMGKILIQRDKVTKLPHLYYSALPGDIARRHVLLLDPMLATGGTAMAAIQVLLDGGVQEGNIVFVNMLSSPEGLGVVCRRHPQVQIVTSAVEERLNADAYMIPGIGDFGDRYHGTDA